jgi:hypothetical protein
VTLGFLILIGYGGKYIPTVYEAEEVARLKKEAEDRLRSETRIVKGMKCRQDPGRIARELSGE